MTDRPLNDFETRTLDNIATHGWSALHVFDPDGLGAEFSYSVGFTGMAATDPELFTEYATSANWFWRHQGHTGHPDVIQLVWPGSKDGLFPWDDGCSPDVIAAQPRLWA